MKKRNYILFTIGILLIVLLCFLGIKSNTSLLNSKNSNNELSFYEEDAFVNENIFENSYSKVLKIGDKLDIKDIVVNKDLSTIKYVSNSDETVTQVENNIITAITDGESIITYKLGDEEITINITVESTTSTALSSEKSAGQVFFLNTQTATLETNEAILIKGANEEYALLDTSNKMINSSCQSLVRRIQYYANSKKVTLKYVILSHYHGDHINCYAPLLNDNNITVENVVLKDTMLSHSIYKDMVNKSKSKNVNIIKTNKIKDGDYLALGNTKLYLYNTDDVFENNKKCYNQVKIIKFKSIEKTSDLTNAFLKKDNNYFIMNSASESNYTTTSSKNKRKIDILPDNNNNITFYAKKREIRNSCSENANSITVLVDFTVNENDHRYAYLPSDIENNGYPIWGAYNKRVNRIIYGSGTTYPYKVRDGEIKSRSTVVHRASEYRAAQAVKDKIGENNLFKITIYQQSHHGYNNAKDALEILGFDKERPANYPLYAIATLVDKQKKAVSDYLQSNSYMKLYKATNNGKNNMSTGIYEYGISCNISTTGTTRCTGNA